MINVIIIMQKLHFKNNTGMEFTHLRKPNKVFYKMENSGA